MLFRKKIWFLRIEQIKCKLILGRRSIFCKWKYIYVGVDCPVGDIGPRSVLILNYKGQYMSVHAWLCIDEFENLLFKRKFNVFFVSCSFIQLNFFISTWVKKWIK